MASNISYDNFVSNLRALNVQDALDEVVVERLIPLETKVGGISGITTREFLAGGGTFAGTCLTVSATNSSDHHFITVPVQIVLNETSAGSGSYDINLSLGPHCVPAVFSQGIYTIVGSNTVIFNVIADTNKALDWAHGEVVGDTLHLTSGRFSFVFSVQHQ